MPQGSKQNPARNGISSEVLSLAFDLGFRIAIPLVLFGVGGRFLDKKFDTDFLFLLLGIILSLVASSLLIIFKIRQIFANLNNQEPKSEVEASTHQNEQP